MTGANIAEKSVTLTFDEEIELAQMNIKIIQDEDPFDEKPIFEAKTGAVEKIYLYSDEINKNNTNVHEENIISQVDGVIDRVEDEVVRTKLYPKCYVNFPKVLFSDAAKIRQGQHIRYIIKKSSGFRIQEIIPIDVKVTNPKGVEILKLLNEIK